MNQAVVVLRTVVDMAIIRGWMKGNLARIKMADWTICGVGGKGRGCGSHHCSRISGEKAAWLQRISRSRNEDWMIQ